MRTLAPRKELADTISAARDLADLGSLDVLRGQLVDPQAPQFLEYLRRTLGAADDERLLGVFLDMDGYFIASECLAMGSTHNVELAFRPLISRILNLGARELILAHNHPSGNPTPSAADSDVTSRLQHLLAALDCQLRDHLIVCARSCYSMARAGML